MLGLGLGLLVGNPLGVVLLVGVGLIAGHLYDDLPAPPAPRAEDPLEQEPEPVRPREHPPAGAPPVERRPVADGRASYAALGVAEDASDAAVRRAFRRLAAQAHPDRVAHLGREEGERATRRFQEVQQAYAEIRRLRGR